MARRMSPTSSVDISHESMMKWWQRASPGQGTYREVRWLWKMSRSWSCPISSDVSYGFLAGWKHWCNEGCHCIAGGDARTGDDGWWSFRGCPGLGPPGRRALHGLHCSSRLCGQTSFCTFSRSTMLSASQTSAVGGGASSQLVPVPKSQSRRQAARRKAEEEGLCFKKEKKKQHEVWGPGWYPWIWLDWGQDWFCHLGYVLAKVGDCSAFFGWMGAAEKLFHSLCPFLDVSQRVAWAQR